DLLQQVESLRARRNEISAQMKNGQPNPKLIEQGKQLKVELADREELLDKTAEELSSILRQVPNIALDHVPVGETEDDNVVTKTVGEKPQFSFQPKPHWEILATRDMMDKERAAKISGSRFTYLKGGIVQLQFALVQFVMDVLGDEETLKKIIEKNGLNISSKPFTPVLPPAMLRTEPYVASARLNAAEVTYKLDGDDLWLNASAEHTLCTMYWNEILPEEQLPIRYIGYLTSFRREAGTYGKDTEGIIRLHQFDKLEMEVFSTSETGLDEHKFLYAIQEYFVQQLGIHYQFIEKCTVDIGKPNAAGIDINCWYPGQDRFIETHTADYMTDFQARDLNTRTKTADGTSLVHTNDATAFAMSRILAAITENYQNEDGTINIPDVLQKYMGGKTQI
ncbi:serine--tRNA ligase, partial [Candidatus Saccharibacteria bacterium]|nr:serine--tRNA ligase [Candidatus Saccharibacteria bacterium]